MVIVKIIGGIGNQMFQYAAGKRLALRNRTSLRLDISAFKGSGPRRYSLGCFNIKEHFVNEKKTAAFIDKGNRGKESIAARLRNGLGLSRKYQVIRQLYADNMAGRVLDARGNVYLDGYWQSENYFKDIKDVIQREFTWKRAPGLSNEMLLDEMRNTNSVAVHVRRGDYVSDPNTHACHGVLSLDYYYQCVALIAERIDYPHFFVFSDEPDWAKENFRIDQPVAFVYGKRNDVNNHDHEDLWLMSQCKHAIIANSSFSWWGAWLIRNPRKHVFAPRKWFADPRYEVEPIVPATWIKI